MPCEMQKHKINLVCYALHCIFVYKIVLAVLVYYFLEERFWNEKIFCHTCDCDCICHCFG